MADIDPLDASLQAASAAQEAAAQAPVLEPLARLYGEPLMSCPQGLYIPPDALRVILERFEGPLDLLLFLIRSQKFDVLDIPMATLTDQYMAYVELIRRSNLSLASAYLVMAATLMSIKSRMLLPVPVREDDDEEPADPRAELMRRLLEYEAIKAGAKALDELPRLGRDFDLLYGVEVPEDERLLPEADPQDLAEAWLDVVGRLKLAAHHKIEMQPLSVRESMSSVLRRLSGRRYLTLTKLAGADLAGKTRDEAAAAIAVWCLALLELAKAGLVRLTQASPFAPIYVTPPSPAPEGEPQAVAAQALALALEGLSGTEEAASDKEKAQPPKALRLI